MKREENVGLGWGSALAVFGVLAVLRLLAADFRYFFEQDEMSLAIGIASILEGNVGYLYHYGPQVGYYRLVAFLSERAGGIAWIPIVMPALSAVAGAAIPAATLVAFRNELPGRVRLLAGAVVACSPILWVSSQYGNTAVVSAAFGVLGLVVLSNRPGRIGIASGLALCAVAVLVRADAVLLAPVVAFLVFRATGDARKGIAALAAGAVGFGAVWLSIRVLDPLVSASAVDVAEHFADDELRTLFWEHGVWAFSPLVLVFALYGAEALADRARALAWMVALWCLPVFGFYFSATTTPRYFLLAVVPVGILAAAGLERFAVRSRRRRAAWAVGLGAAFVHLWVGLGHFTSSNWTSMFTAPSFQTHDGPMPTGALVYQGYHRGDGVLGPSVRRSGPWGSWSLVAQAVDPRLERVRDADAGSVPARVLVLLDDWNGHVFQFHALKAGAAITGRDAGPEFIAPTHFSLGHVTLTTVGNLPDRIEALPPLDLAAGDEVWHVVPFAPFPLNELVARLAPGLVLDGPIAGAGSDLEVYAVRAEVGS